MALVARTPETRPIYADGPTDAVALSFTTTPLCRLVTFDAPGPDAVRLTLKPGVSTDDVVGALHRVSTSATPYHALLSGVARWQAEGRTVTLFTDGPTADLQRGLCHPAFSITPGAFTGPKRTANIATPEGRPFADELRLTATDARGAERLFAQRRASVLIGGPATDDGAAQLFVTVLLLPREGATHLEAAVEAAVDPADLVRFFVRPPSAPMPGLLPPSLGGDTTAPKTARPAPLAATREVAVGFDAQSDLERAVAERLQVKLQPSGYRVALAPAARETVRARQPTSSQLTLQSLLLPPSPTAALVVLLEAAGTPERIVPALTTIASAPDPDEAARAQARRLLPELPLVPLFSRGVGVTHAPDVRQLRRDALGLPRLDDAFLAPE